MLQSAAVLRGARRARRTVARPARRRERSLLQGIDPARRGVRSPSEKPAPAFGGAVQTRRREPRALSRDSRKTGRAGDAEADPRLAGTPGTRRVRNQSADARPGTAPESARVTARVIRTPGVTERRERRELRRALPA